MRNKQRKSGTEPQHTQKKKRKEKKKRGERGRKTK